ncbi:hypothetical protein CHLRE_10g458750v5 [Chlamydomonas reinhardtii]|uniref:Uncharacterized protein n=1 Tax=Chlamydomonas reinhardtii TaxID=3055 RepID=A0A2K3DBR1_CHLRE|nr:uncharacterized protein CHLRE_10g458750v5 [Chlamydomonas reinhardtii]XP_042920509.1 uncharacterized protein CHLRE_10g458750v5 [Chlamydomonas reinhardtii]PNW77962.1 hypothetical protein CHLRE_10g458750v5 [Chlamydomonas reinhardtii]PNW77963.1 hypothetical protein CHLRE_10g458750v5 [Chlamydomonas reinhardtii]
MSTATVTRVRKKIEGLSRRLEALEKRIERVKRDALAITGMHSSAPVAARLAAPE